MSEKKEKKKLPPPFSGKTGIKGSENSVVAVVADAIRSLISIWNSKIAKNATGEPEEERDTESMSRNENVLPQILS